MTRKKFLYIVLIIVFTYLICWMFNIVPVVLDISEEQKNTGIKIEIGDTVRPLEFMNLNEGKWEMYIKYSLNDVVSEKRLLNGRVFKCSDKNVIIQIKENLNCIYTGADVTTADSKFFIYQNGNLKFVTNISLDESIGIQSINYGWVSNSNLKPLFKEFKKVNTPFIIFN